MKIRARMSTSADGYVTTPAGWPVLTADPAFVSGQSHGIPEFQKRCEAVLRGRKTFAPALGNDRWPWPDLDVFVLGSNVSTEGAPVPIVTDRDPARLLEKLRAANRGGDVHLVGGPQTIESFRALGAPGQARAPGDPGAPRRRHAAHARAQPRQRARARVRALAARGHGGNRLRLQVPQPGE